MREREEMAHERNEFSFSFALLFPHPFYRQTLLRNPPSNLVKKLTVFSILALLGVLLGTSQASAAARYSVASGDWDSTATWSETHNGASGASVPGAGDTVTIEGIDNVTVNVADAACASIQLGSPTSGGGAGTLTFAANSQLTVSGAVSLGNSGSANRRGTVIMTAGGTLICAALTTSSTTDVWTPGTGMVEITGTTTLPSARITTFNNVSDLRQSRRLVRG